MYAAIVSTLSCKGGRTGPLEVTRTTCLFDMAGGVGRERFTVRGRRQKVSRAAQGGPATSPGVRRQAGQRVRGGQAAAGGGRRVRNSRIQSRDNTRNRNEGGNLLLAGRQEGGGRPRWDRPPLLAHHRTPRRCKYDRSRRPPCCPQRAPRPRAPWLRRSRVQQRQAPPLARPPARRESRPQRSETLWARQAIRQDSVEASLSPGRASAIRAGGGPELAY